MLWVGLAGDLTPLQRLAGEVGVAVRSAGIALPRRPFTPHLTVARYRDAPTGASSAAVAVAALAAYAGPAFSVGELRLMQSRLGAGVRHEAVACWPLSGGSPQ